MTRALPAGYAPFATWAEVQEHIRTGAQGGVAYRAPLSYRPTWLVTTRAGAGSARNSPGGTIRVIPWDCPAESDPFDADEGHLDRFLKRTPHAAPVAL